VVLNPAPGSKQGPWRPKAIQTVVGFHNSLPPFLFRVLPHLFFQRRQPRPGTTVLLGWGAFENRCYICPSDPHAASGSRAGSFGHLQGGTSGQTGAKPTPLTGRRSRNKPLTPPARGGAAPLRAGPVRALFFFFHRRSEVRTTFLRPGSSKHPMSEAKVADRAGGKNTGPASRTNRGERSFNDAFNLHDVQNAYSGPQLGPSRTSPGELLPVLAAGPTCRKRKPRAFEETRRPFNAGAPAPFWEAPNGAHGRRPSSVPGSFQEPRLKVEGLGGGGGGRGTLSSTQPGGGEVISAGLVN